MSKHKEAKISILIPEIATQTMNEMLGDLILQNQIYTYNIGKILKTDNVIMISSDRELSEEEVIKYYMQIMIYHQGIGETLTEKQLEMRDEEVKNKWLNGYFNYWILEEEEA
jgi:hypothetical protein